VHGNNSITGDGQTTVPEKVAFYAAIGAIDLFIPVYCITE
jgi:hypothetical protein